MSEASMIVGGYELRNCVATGNATQIWEVTVPGNPTQLAMKLMLDTARKKPELVAVLKREYRIGRSLEHPSIVQFHSIEVNRDHAFFVMDFFRAPSLKAQIMSSRAETQSRFKKIAEALCQVYAYMHEKGWLHRDIKPDNILVSKTGEVRVIDFSLSSRVVKGIGKLVGGNQSRIVGTRTYIAPETILKKTPTVQSEIYSLGVTLYEILTGSPPFAGVNPNDLLKKHLAELPGQPSIVNPNVTPDLDQVILRMLAKKPAKRPADMRELLSIFRSLRCFTEDPFERYQRKTQESKEAEKTSIDKRLDSRADADRTEQGLPAPAKYVKSKPKTAGVELVQPLKKAKAAAPAIPGMMPQMMHPQQMMPQQMMHPQQMMPQQMMPQQMMHPQQMMPQQMMPQQMMPQQMMPQQMMPQQMMPQQMIPQQMMPQQMMPQQMMPQQMMPQQMMPQQSVVSQSHAEAAAEEESARQKSLLLPLDRRSAPAPRKDIDVEALEFMTDLPDIA